MTPRPDGPEPDPVPPPPPDRFEVVRELGRGAFGVVWLARRKKHGIEVVEDHVAVKRLIASDAPVEEGIKRFVREVNAIRKLNHQSIVTLLDFDNDEYGPYLVMEYVDGKNLAQHLAERGQLSVEEVTKIGIELAKALHYAHTRAERVIHRDVKPSNVLLSKGDGIPRLVDFGLARKGTESEDPGTGVSSGTWDYASPEQRQGKAVDHRTDIFSLGATLYQVATGSSPGYRIVADKIPTPLRSVILQATAEEPQNRHFSMEDMHRALVASAEEPEVPAAPAEARDENLCPLCGQHPLAGYRFCPNSGQGLFQVCSICKVENPLKTRYCIQCGADVEAVDQALESLRVAKEREEEKDYERATREYEKVLELLHNHRPARAIYDRAVQARDRISSVLQQRKLVTDSAEKKMAEGDFDEAERIVQEAISNDPTYAPYQEYVESIPRRKRTELLKTARRLFAEWDLESAFQMAQDALAVPVPGKREAERFLGTVRRKRSDFRELAGQVAEHLRTAHYREVLELCDTATEQFPNHPRLDVWAGEARERLSECARLLEQGDEALANGHFRQAESYFKEAHRVCPQEPGGREGIKRARQGNYESTLAAANESFEQHKWRAALDLYVQAQQVAPEAPEARSGEEACRRKLGRRKLLRYVVIGVFVLALLALGAVGPITSVLIGQGELELAARLHRTFGVIMFNRNSVEHDFGEAYRERAAQQKDHAEAQRMLAQALAYDPKNDRVRLELIAVTEKLAERDLADGDDFGAQAWIRRATQAAGDGGPDFEDQHRRLQREERRITGLIGQAILADLSPKVSEPRFYQHRDAKLEWTCKPESPIRELFRVEEESGATVPFLRTLDSFTLQLELAEEGRNPLTFRATADGDNRVDFTVDLVYDHVEPVISIDEPSLRTNTRQKQVLVTVRDDSVLWGYDVAEVWIECAATGQRYEGELLEGKWGATVSLPGEERRAEFTARARDRAGNVGAAKFTVRLKESIGTVSLQPADALPKVGDRYYTRDGRLVVEATTDEREIVPERSWLSVKPADGEAVELDLKPEDLESVGEKTRIRRRVDLSEGVNTIRVVIADSAGNEQSSEPVHVCLDTTAPRIEPEEIRPPEGGALRTLDDVPHVIAPARPTVVVHLVDQQIHVLKVNGADEPAPDDGRLTLKVKPGMNVFEIEAADLAGNAAPPVTVRLAFHPLPAEAVVENGRFYGAKGEKREMLFVPAGEVEIDLEKGSAVKATTGSFLIDREEVTEDTGAPLTGYSFTRARAHARSLGKDIPSEAEWCRAAAYLGGEGGRISGLADGASEWVLAHGEADVSAIRGGATMGGLDKPGLYRIPWPTGTAQKFIGFRCVIRLGE